MAAIETVSAREILDSRGFPTVEATVTLAAELDAAGLELERVIPVMPLLSEVWVVVVRKPGSS